MIAVKQCRSGYAVLLFMVLWAGGCVAQTAPAEPSQVAPAPSEGSVIRIGAGDLLEIRVFGIPELTQETRVSGQGVISVPLIGAVQVQGMSTEEAQKAIAQRLVEGGYVRNPEVSVFVKEYATQGITVLGEVTRAGIYPLLGTRRLFDVISAAGGTTNKAGRLITITRRDAPDKPIYVELTDDPARSTASNVLVQPGDTVVVAKAGVVYVVGEVVKPGGFLMENTSSVTVMQAIALAQGTTRVAKLGNAKLIRKTATGMQEIPIDLSKVMSAKAPDPALQAEDILFVPASAGKNAARRGLEAIIQAATGMAIYSTVR